MTQGQEEYPFEALEPIPFSYGCAGLVSTVIFFTIINRIVTSIGPPKSVDTDTWRWNNLFISWIHAFITGLWDILCFVLYPVMLGDLVAYHNHFIYGMVVFSTGYFFYDFLDIVVNKKALAQWEVVLHHIAVAGMFFYNVYLCRCIPYNAVALLAEVNSFFLHSRKLMQMSKVKYDHILYRTNVWINLTTFVFCRFGGLAWIYYGMAVFCHRVTRIYFGLLTSSMIVMLFINIVLFHRLIKNDILRSRRAIKKKTDADRVLTNGTMPHSHSNNNIKENGFITNGVHKKVL